MIRAASPRRFGPLPSGISAGVACVTPTSTFQSWVPLAASRACSQPFSSAISAAPPQISGEAAIGPSVR